MRISLHHAALYQQHYKTHPPVMLPSRWVDRVQELADRVQARTILDYGCGPSRGISNFLPYPVRDYDPGVEGLDARPKKAELVISIHVLEHVEAECVDAVLADLISLAQKALFVVVSCEPSTKLLPDGSPWHTFVRDAGWWRIKLADFQTQPVMKARPGAEYAALRLA
jgi:hypothetical protein